MRGSAHPVKISIWACESIFIGPVTCPSLLLPLLLSPSFQTPLPSVSKQYLASFQSGQHIQEPNLKSWAGEYCGLVEAICALPLSPQAGLYHVCALGVTSNH